MKGKSRILALVAVTSLLLVPASVGASEWQWDGTIYGWFSDVGLNASLNDHEIIGGEVEVKDLINRLDFMFEVNIQGQRGKWGMYLDLAYFDFNDDPVRIPLPGPVGNTLVSQGDFEQTLIDAAAIYNPSGDGLGFSLLGGARILDLDQEVRLHIETPVGPTETFRRTASGTLVDAMIGVRWSTVFAERWLFNLKGDTSTGQTEFTLGGLAAIGYSFGKEGRYSVLAGYRYLQFEMQDEDQNTKLETRLTMSGGFLAFRIGF